MKKLASLFAAGLLSLAAIPAQAHELTGTLKKIADSGEIVVGHRESSVPFAYLDENQKPIGYSIDICMKIVEALGKTVGKELNVRFVPVNPQTRIPLLANGTINLECGSTTNNLTRQQQVSYLPTTFITGTKLLVKKDGGINSIDDMEGKTIALAQGTTNERAIKAYIESKGMKVDILPVKDHAEGFLALETDRVDAYSTDHILLFGLISKAKSPDDYTVVGDFLSFDPYAIMVPRNEADYELEATKAVAALFRSGEIEKIYSKWFDPLGVPLDSTLKTAFQIQALPE
jgi:glutamate/aspartate transport system substrate-binding protein